MPEFTWTTDPKEAESEQASIRELVITSNVQPGACDFDSGLAIGTAYDENTRQAVAVALRFDRQGYFDKRPLSATVEVDFPYTPGLLAFRVGPAICKLLDELEDEFDLLLFDGQGIAHPRGVGLASHIGALYDKMSVGVTRNNLFGRLFEPPGDIGDAVKIFHPASNDVIGYSIVLGSNCGPVYISPGHLVGPEGSLEIVRTITNRDTCFPPALARAHGMANSLSRSIWREAQKEIHV